MTKDAIDQLDLIWGAKAIGEAIGVNSRRAFYYLENDFITGAKQVGDRWVISRRVLVRQFVPEGAAADAE